MTTTGRAVHLPRAAAALRLPLWQRSQQRLRERYGFDMDAPDALDRARALVAENPSDPEMALLLGSVLSTRGETDLAEMEVRRALELAPRLPRAHTTLATLLMNRGMQEEALRSARDATALDKEDPTILYNLGLAEWFAGDRSKARDALDRAGDALAGATAAAVSGEPGDDGSATTVRHRRRWWRLGRRD